ncbi:polymorphic toxin type 44 domain-containing protein [Zymobacter sp. IVIA_12111.31 C1]|uniref:polymorphic toxin type 44 domain-containing protein n=1 Tax=Zymobacter sp. IVIA_12111.31 C1 TaxID=3394854 RepID=UPI0039C29551
MKLKQYLSERQAKVIEDSWAWSKLNDYDYYFDIWSNIHYGYVGYHIGFSEDVLTGGASAIQLYHDELGQKHTYQYHSENGNFFNRFDDVTDQISIRLGIDLAKEKSPQELQLHDLVSKLEEVPLPWGNGESKAKRKHICLQQYC